MNNNYLHSEFPQSVGKIIPSADTNYNDFVIKPPDKNVTSGRISNRLIIDSRDRDLQKYPDPNNYVIHLNNKLRDAVSIELVRGCIPKSQYNINISNNKLHYSFDLCTIDCIEIPPGNYPKENLGDGSSLDLINTINEMFIQKHGDPSLKIKYDPLTNKIKVKNTTPDNFMLVFLHRDLYKKCSNTISNKPPTYIDNSIGSVIGFPPSIITFIDNITTITAPNVVNLGSCQYIILNIPELHRLEAQKASLIDAYTIIPFKCDSNCAIINASTSPNLCDAKYYNPPMGKLSKLTIQFKNYDGSYYDFNGMDHFLDFKIVCLNQSTKYNLNTTFC